MAANMRGSGVTERVAYLTTEYTLRYGKKKDPVKAREYAGNGNSARMFATI
jgi:hypothetical protein